jgi:osmoprotectant transport system substrate-binding protein
MKRTLASLAAGIAGVLLLTACGGGGSGGGSDPLAPAGGGEAPAAADVVRVGSEQFPENQLLAEIYAQALEAKGVKVERKFSIGARETYFVALQDGSIDVVPDYNGNLLRYLSPDATESSPTDVYAALQTALPDNLTVLEQAAAENKDAFTVTRATAEKYNATSIEDIVPFCGEIIFGGPTQFQERPYGIEGMKKNYNCEFKEFKALDTGGPLTVAALRDGTIQGADLFTTDPALPANDFVTLEDPKNNFPAQNIVPLINKAKGVGPVAEALNGVSAKLTQQELLAIDVKQFEKTATDAVIAKEWLTAQGLV